MTKHILLVDDDDLFCQTLSRSLQRRGFRVTALHSTAQCLAAIERLQVDYAVVDLKMGDTSGLSVIPALRRRFPNAAILMLTGYASIATAVEAIKIGADNYLQKPAGSKAILDALESATSHKERPATAIEELAPPSLNRLTWEHIQRVLHENSGNISETARQLGMHRRTLQRKLQKRPVKK